MYSPRAVVYRNDIVCLFCIQISMSFHFLLLRFVPTRFFSFPFNKKIKKKLIASGTHRIRHSRTILVGAEQHAIYRWWSIWCCALLRVTQRCGLYIVDCQSCHQPPCFRESGWLDSVSAEKRRWFDSSGMRRGCSDSIFVSHFDSVSIQLFKYAIKTR